MDYQPEQIERKWREYWEKNRVYQVSNDTNKPKYYVLDMFPYPSGEGLHVGHPLGYVASDIVARYKRLCGFNVLHPMGYDAFGLPAEQYAIQTGVHPAQSTQQNIQRYRKQLDNLAFVTIGRGRYQLANQNTTVGHSKFSFGCLVVIIIKKPIRQKISNL
jgi:leucyl-tRNA synthetase